MGLPRRDPSIYPPSHLLVGLGRFLALKYHVSRVIPMGKGKNFAPFGIELGLFGSSVLLNHIARYSRNRPPQMLPPLQGCFLYISNPRPPWSSMPA
ncbi:hypothetical protein TNCV_2462251 [Trichonephila clavipes]|nr:hypothetical protein TNCV_2462251 [Trichonephila clavipes]